MTKKDNLDEIPSEYRNTPDHNFSMWNFAETVKPENLHYLLMRLAGESKKEEYQLSILAEAAKHGVGTRDELFQEFRKYQNPVLNRFKVVNASDWLTSEPPPPDQIIKDICDRGDKVGIIGGSKQKKSFFFIQLMLCLATGREFLGYLVPKKRRVLAIQFEIQPNHYHRRISMMAKAMGISAEELGENLQIGNARGQGVTADNVTGEICRIAREKEAEIVAFDPLYKLMNEGENAASDFRPILAAFDRLAEEMEVAVVYVHHDPKGEAGDRNLQDRGAGSNILGRDYDASFFLSPHSCGDDNVSVVDVLLRNYPPIDAKCIEWHGKSFIPRTDLPATKKTSKTKRNEKLPLPSYEPRAIELVKDKPMKISIFKDAMRRDCALTVDRTKTVIDSLTNNGKLAIHSERSRGKNDCWIGLPAAIEEMKRKRV